MLAQSIGAEDEFGICATQEKIMTPGFERSNMPRLIFAALGFSSKLNPAMFEVRMSPREFPAHPGCAGAVLARHPGIPRFIA